MSNLDPISSFVVTHLIDMISGIIMPAMLAIFILGVLTRFLVFYTVRSELRFAREFEKRVKKHFTDPSSQKVDSFFMLTKALIEKTFHEVFELRARFKRRNMDHVMVVTDRLFLVQDGVTFVLRDTLRQIQYLRREGFPPKLVEVSRNVFDANPVFNKVLGVFPANITNELVNILPGLFIIGGIFGTFLGISKGLSGLGGMDLSDIEKSKQIMDQFLILISQAMVKSIIGIGLSVVMSLINTVFSAEATYFDVVNRFSAALEVIWNETTTNTIDLAAMEEKASKDDRRKADAPQPQPPAPGAGRAA